MKWLFLICLLPVINLFHPGMPLVHDGQDHVARLANFYVVLKEGVVVPRWAPNLNWGYGHPVLMFLYPFPEYVASIFHFIGFSLVDSTKLVFGLSFIASGMTMYMWLKAAFGRRAAIVGSLLYTFAPYRFVDMYVRGALGEHVAFIFPPLILYFLYKKSFMAAAFALAGLILSHNAVALMFIPILVFYGFYKKPLFLLLGFSLSAFFWLPALMEGKFTLREIVTSGEALKRFVSWQNILYSPWNLNGEVPKALGIAQWIGIIAAISLWMKVKIRVGSILLLFFFSLFMMTSASREIWQSSSLLQNFQFPWRFLSLSTFLAATLGGIAFAKSKKLFIIFYSLFIILITVPMWHPKGYTVHDDSFYSGVYKGTTDTGESSPIWSVRFMEHTAANPLAIVDGDATVTVGKRTSTVHEYTLDVRKPTLMVENTLYFPNWRIYINDVQTGVEWQNPDYRGLMTFRVTPGENQKVRVVFEDTKVRTIANWISVVSLLLCLLYLLL